MKIETYIAKDGKEFKIEHNCIRYERELAIKHIPFKNKGYMGYECWYYISSIEDFEALKKYITTIVQEGTRTEFYCNFNEKNINDWISYQIERYVDDVDTCNFTSFKETKKGFEEIQKDFEELEEIFNIDVR